MYRIWIGLLTLVVACTPKTKTPNTSQNIVNSEASKIGEIYTDHSYSGARLNGFEQINDTLYRATIRPENTPVNSSPWYGFAVWADAPTTATIQLTYTDGYKHRFTPKLSDDGLNWTPISEGRYNIDTTDHTAYLNLDLTAKKLYISAQENIHTDLIDQWAKAQTSHPNVIYTTVGKSVQDAPIHLLKYNNPKAQNSILLIGRQHPPEVPGGTIAMMAFIEALLSESELAQEFRANFEILAFPLLNPDGVAMGNWRHNANGIDINRDWSEFTQPETQLVRDYIMAPEQKDIREGLRYGIDFHTSHSGPYLLIMKEPYAHLRPVLTEQWTHSIAAERNETLDLRPRDQTLPYCYNWMIRDLSIEAVTYEEGDEIDRTIARKRAKDYARLLMKTLLQNQE